MGGGDLSDVSVLAHLLQGRLAAVTGAAASAAGRIEVPRCEAMCAVTAMLRAQA